MRSCDSSYTRYLAALRRPLTHAACVSRRLFFHTRNLLCISSCTCCVLVLLAHCCNLFYFSFSCVSLSVGQSAQHASVARTHVQVYMSGLLAVPRNDDMRPYPQFCDSYLFQISDCSFDGYNSPTVLGQLRPGSTYYVPFVHLTLTHISVNKDIRSVQTDNGMHSRRTTGFKLGSTSRKSRKPPHL